MVLKKQGVRKPRAGGGAWRTVLWGGGNKTVGEGVANGSTEPWGWWYNKTAGEGVEWFYRTMWVPV